ncbi:retron system putative HNH endonuclease [Flavobacterium sp.]|uniref:retron system putative HNH endonuclease n=1 Tax=Flavobacterium sp. TaxID=239 RepID=UPI0025B889C2|nr:retron system putative HNH endonuclease [Flavobacterium sp.]MBA4155334.1 TIGR02646 family protein [Flavobacterium sp.]
MRPVVKWPVGHAYLTYTITNVYKPHKGAKKHLEANLGGYCSYCEKPVTDEAMHVEHIRPKSVHANLKFEWDNFLISCQRCNGPDNKGVKDVIVNNTHMPHLNNTYSSISYFEDGTVTVTPGLDSHETAKSRSLIELVGLDRILGHPQHLEGDKRYERRKTIWEIAVKMKTNYIKVNSSLTPDFIALCASQMGFWSVWMKVFSDCSEVQNELILSFNGTFLDCCKSDINRNLLP